MANIGEHFMTCESGWKRIELENAKNLKMNGFTINNRPYGSNGTILWNSGNVKGEYVEFEVVASNIRFIGLRSSDSGSINVYINDVLMEDDISLVGSDVVSSTSNSYCSLQYMYDLEEDTNLKIKIEANGDGYIYLDAIDIVNSDKIGNQLPQPEVGWKRIDSTTDYIDANMNNISDSNCYGGSVLYSDNITNLSKFVKFRFWGSKLRLIAVSSLSYDDTINITINGEDYTFSESISTTTKYCTIVFEKELKQGIHEVVIIPSKKAFNLDAIDIDDNGYMITMLGQESPTPDNGWNRFDSNESLVLYTGKDWNEINRPNAFKGSIRETIAKGEYYQFNFKGKGFRLIVKTNSNYSTQNAINVEMDDTNIGNYSHYTSTGKDKILVFEHTFADEGSHVVKVTNVSDIINIDCIDILEGTMLPTLSRDYEFPVAVIEKSDLEGYCNSLVNGEEQLLAVVNGNVFSLVLTNGNGGYLEYSQTT